jgi:hypothetical protein
VDASEWESCQDRSRLLATVQGMASDRKLRLVAAALCRSVWDVMDREESRQAVLAVEQFADGLLTEAEFLAARARSRQAALYATEALSYSPHDVGSKRLRCAIYAANTAIHASHGTAIPFLKSIGETAAWASGAIGGYPYRAGEEGQLAVLRCVLGNPFLPVTPLGTSLLTWEHGVLTKLAQAAYDDRSFPAGTLDPGRLAVLADALEEAGCVEAGILAHLRSAVPLPCPATRGE